MPELSSTTYQALSRNRWRTAWLMMLFPAMIATITILAVFVLAVFSEADMESAAVSAAEISIIVLPIVTVVSVLWIIIALLGGRKMVLSLAGAKPIEKKDQPELYRIVENLAIQTGIPTPKIYVIDDSSMNAFATGYSPKRAAVAITKGLLEKLDKSELQAVMAHEMGHILHRDTRVMLVAITMVGIIQLLAEIILRIVFRSLTHSSGNRKGGKGSGQAIIILIVVALVIWIISFLGAIFVQMGISRKREYMADAESAHLTRHPESLISALKKISKDPRVEVLDGKRTVAALCIADPLEKKQNFWDKLSGLFATHPPVQERIAALNAMGS